MEAIKIQTTLRGYYAWVLQQMTERNREPQADTAAHLLRLWIDANKQELAEDGLSRVDFHSEMEKREKVTDINRRDTQAG